MECKIGIVYRGGKRETVVVDGGEAFQELLHQISDMTQLPICCQRLIAKGRKIDTKATGSVEEVLAGVLDKKRQVKMLITPNQQGQDLGQQTQQSQLVSTTTTTSPDVAVVGVVDCCSDKEETETVVVRVVYGKKNIHLRMDGSATISKLKTHICNHFGVATNFQRLIMEGGHDDESVLLKTAATNKSTLKVLLLLNKAFHQRQETIDQVAELEEQVTTIEKQVGHLTRQMDRNYRTAADLAVEVSALDQRIQTIVDNIQHIISSVRNDDSGIREEKNFDETERRIMTLQEQIKVLQSRLVVSRC